MESMINVLVHTTLRGEMARSCLVAGGVRALAMIMWYNTTERGNANDTGGVRQVQVNIRV